MMKKQFLFVVSILWGIVTGCANSAPKAGDKWDLALYSDQTTAASGNITIALDGIRTANGGGGNTYVSVDVSYVNTAIKAFDYKIDSPKIVRESNGAEYAVSCLPFIVPGTLKLECDVTSWVYYTATLPTNLETENYYLTYKTNHKSIKICLYPLPDEMRKGYQLTYVVDGAKKTIQMALDGKPIPYFEWLDKTNVYYCDQWFLDPELTIPAAGTLVTESISLYGAASPILRYNAPSSTSSCFISGYNHIPATKEVYVPKSFDGRDVYSILAGSFSDAVSNMESIHIPKTIKSISGVYNFDQCEDLKRVCFEGTSSEWDSINQATFKGDVEIIFGQY